MLAEGWIGEHDVPMESFAIGDTNDGSKSHSRNAITACTADLTIGGYKYMTNGGPFALPTMFLIDFVVIGVSVMWLMKAPKKR